MSNFFYATTSIEPNPDELNAFAISTGIALLAMEWVKHRSPEESLAMLRLAHAIQDEELEQRYEGSPAPNVDLLKAKLYMAGAEYEDRHEAFCEEVNHLLAIEKQGMEKRNAD